VALVIISAEGPHGEANPTGYGETAYQKCGAADTPTTLNLSSWGSFWGRSIIHSTREVNLAVARRARCCWLNHPHPGADLDDAITGVGD
jgi:hypothetical protein